MRWCRVWCHVALCCLSCLPLVGLAEEPVNESEAPPSPFAHRTMFVQIRYTPSAQFRTGFRSEDGSVAVRHHDVTGSIIRPIQGGGVMMLSLSHDWEEFRFRGTDEIDGLMSRAESTGISLLYNGPLREDWSLFAMLSGRTAREAQASASDAYTGSASFLVQYQWTDSFQLGVGAMAGRRLEQRNSLFPFAAIYWAITDRLKLRTTRGLQLAYQLDERGRWEAALNNEYFRHAFRLNENGPGEGGVFRSKAIVTTGSVMFRPNPGMSFGAEIGFAPWRDYRVRDADNRTIFDDRLKPGTTAAMTASITF